MKKPKPVKKQREGYVKPPKDFEVPELEVGETFEAVFEITKKKDGLCITAWDGISVDEKKERDEAEPEESIGAGAKRTMEGAY